MRTLDIAHISEVAGGDHKLADDVLEFGGGGALIGELIGGPPGAAIGGLVGAAAGVIDYLV